jgi:hypothetical protein
MHLFGTENTDFIAAMYGDFTLVFNKGTAKIMNYFQGQNLSLSEAKNTSFSAIGRLSPYYGQMKVTLFENAFSKVKIDYEKLPPCFEVINIQIEHI